MADHHNECADHADRGRYARATTVHHEHEVRREPSMALTRWETGADGRRREVLTPLCDECHNVRHRRFEGRRRAQVTEERW